MAFSPASTWIVLACTLLSACGGPDRQWIPARELPAFQEASAIVAASTGCELWRGVPRDPTPAQLAGALERAAGHFEPKPLAVEPTDVDWMRAYCATGERMKLKVERPGHETFKLCGGFHADFALVFTNGPHTAEYALCFGCNEVKIAVDGKHVLHLELDDHAIPERFTAYRAK